ncbi:glycosyltransferase family 4 protein [Thermus thermophilus]|uniref:Lipopolysaccharide core biosynthesis protein rfaG n=2 Tax=Thermus thermophilus TaxID=274 RepID=Q72KB7_THET2|nr:glycosyltransferase family 4 protein [Thermus thermophilus]AAS80878.1 lipopolysaccharide core biosynthesis protein rfaG [Thermus thermophilus HB27]QMV30592.1 glycosyltransferase family 4 protein [Thermus thermophilus]WMV95921.1 glycosyltransferase family 4 protein [Thermus thermophilus HB27]BCP66042.1 glycosyl transferase [Thermus thermophilus]
MRVLFLSDARRIGGSEVYLREMLPRVKALGLSPEAALPEAEGTLPVRRALEAAGIPVHAYRDLEALPEAVDLVVASAWYPQSYRRFFARYPRLVLLVHDQIEVFYPLGGRYLYRLGYRLLQVPNLRRARAVLTVSRWAARWLERVHGVKGVHAVPNGVDVERFRPPLPGEKEALKGRYGLKRPAVLVPARMSPEKNHLAVLLTARLLPQVDFLLVGTGELLGLWRRAARLLGLENVRFLGRREDMPELYRAVDAVLLPTLGENQSLATLEAMASGLPVVTTPIPAQAELIQDGLTGRLVPPWPPRLAQALREASPGLGKRARAFVEATHTLDQAARRLAATLKRLWEEG